MAAKISTPKGTRDFSPEVMLKRNYILDTVKEVFKLYGYLPIETPAVENLSTLMGKYGEEGDRLIFKILDSGDVLSKVKANDEVALKDISSKALRYDLTVPFARYVVQHQNEITFPFKRYQMQPVWRADRPQKGRYREFYQCDADVIGSDSLLNEVELIQLMDTVYQRLKLNVTIKINNRKLLMGIAETIGAPEKVVDITVAMDKLDKIGVEKVNEELADRGLGKEAINKLQELLLFKGTDEEKLNFIKQYVSNSDAGQKGVEEVNTVLSLVKDLKASKLELDLTLARGLNYYTGAIFEVKANEGSLQSSITGGGRYDDLTGIFGLKEMSGVGISFGIDRIYDVMEELGLLNDVAAQSGTKVLFINFGKEEGRFCLDLIQRLRSEGIATELYPDAAKPKKQFDYANKKNVPFVALIGSDEMKSGKVSLKDMATGEQDSFSVNELINKLK